MLLASLRLLRTVKYHAHLHLFDLMIEFFCFQRYPIRKPVLKVAIFLTRVWEISNESATGPIHSLFTIGNLCFLLEGEDALPLTVNGL